MKNNKRLRVAPSLLSADFSRLSEEIQAVEAAGADLLHLDVMDGNFVPNISFGQPVIRSLRKVSGMVFDVHLMIENPERYLAEFAEAGADEITFHLEAAKDPEGCLQTIRSLGKKAGISIKPNTKTEAVYPFLEKCDLVLVMTVEPGFGGQKLIPSCLEKIRILRAEIERRGLAVEIEADGGISGENAHLLLEAGCDTVVAGSAVFGKPDYAAAISSIQSPSNKSIERGHL